MEIFGHTPLQLILFLILYGISGVVPLLAALYLLLRRSNAFAPGVTPPVRLRSWTAAFFAVMALAHVWWLLFFICSHDMQSVGYQLIIITDCVLLFITFAGMLLTMLQDRRRRVWPAVVAVIPFVLLSTAYMVYPSELLGLTVEAYLLLLGLVFTGYMALAIRQYGRWLNDNYADLENKRVWLCQTVSLICMLLFVLYVLATDMMLIWLLHIVEILLVGLLLWRVETLPNLETQQTLPQPLPVREQTLPLPLPVREGSEYSQGGDSVAEPSTPLPHREGQGESLLEQIEQLLKDHCVTPQLYLQHDLTLEQLAQEIGTNRSYLSQYFSRQSITYNTYINNLRINHFISLYEQATATKQLFTVQQLAIESGYRSYSTFSRAFTQRMGQNVTVWMRG